MVQPILIDRGQLFLERLVEQLDDLGIALHCRLLFKARPLLRQTPVGKKINGGNLGKICD
jgi:hypothetical protein